MREQIRERLLELAEPDYRDFNLKIAATKQEMLGVRLPTLRKLAKEIWHADWRSYLASFFTPSGDRPELERVIAEELYEETMLQALVIAGARMETAERLAYLSGFIPKLENWAICDSLCSSLKLADREPEVVWEFLQPYLASEHQFFARFGAVMLLGHFINEQYVDRVLAVYDRIDQGDYYTQMAVAWGISVAFVKFPERTMQLLQATRLDDFTYNKALQKITESYRIDKETKTLIRSMKRQVNNGKS